MSRWANGAFLPNISDYFFLHSSSCNDRLWPPNNRPVFANRVCNRSRWIKSRRSSSNLFLIVSFFLSPSIELRLIDFRWFLRGLNVRERCRLPPSNRPNGCPTLTIENPLMTELETVFDRSIEKSNVDERNSVFSSAFDSKRRFTSVS